MTTWEVLIPTMPHRHDQLCRLLAEFGRQYQSGFSVRVMRDNLERPGNASYAKWQELVELSHADYVSWAGDDDWVAPDFVAKVMEALERRPDYVGYAIKYTQNGQEQMHVEHSLHYGGWFTGWTPFNGSRMLARDIVHHNPIRRDLALLATWRTDVQTADAEWAQALRDTGRVRSEVWIPEYLYHYQETDSSWSRWSGPPLPMDPDRIPLLPSYPWLTSHDLCGVRR